MAGRSRVISVKQWAAEMKGLWGSGLAGGFVEVAQEGLREAGMRAVELVREKSNEESFDLGHFRRAWTHTVDRLKLTVHNTMPYSGVIEDGRRPNSAPPPVEAILPWVKRKLQIAPYGPRQQGAKRPDLGKIANSVAFLVARKIGKKGIPGKHILEKADNKISEFVAEEVGKALRRRLEGGEEAS